MGKKIFILSALFTIIGVFGYSQNTVLMGEGNRNEVRLMWLIRSWPVNANGFDVKRRAGSGEWQKLNSQTIIPEISAAKEYSNIDADKNNAARLKEKAGKMISEKRIKPVTSPEYINKINTDTSAAKGMAISFSLDYDFALMNGFGFIDRNVPAAAEYEYGVFANGQAQPLATFKWKYGTTANLDLKYELKFDKIPGKSEVQLRWNFSSKDVKKTSVKGFNVYKISGAGFVRLNSSLIMVPVSGDSSRCTYSDKTAAEKSITTYAVAPVSLFDFEGEKKQSDYNPADFIFPAAPKITNAASVQKEQSQDINISWDYEAAAEAALSGFQVERADLPAKVFKAVSNVLTADKRSFVDATAKVNGAYYQYRVASISKKKQKFYSNEILVYFEAIIKPVKPKGGSGKFVTQANKKYINLSWGNKESNDTVTKGYYLYANFPPGKQLVYKGSIPLIKTNSYQYEVFNSEAATYKFQVAAVNKSGQESDPSDTITVFCPTQDMPFVNVWPFRVDSNRVTLFWNYEDVTDLKHFKVYQDSKQVGTVEKNARNTVKEPFSWTSPALEYGKTYNFEVMSVSESGIESEKSIPRVISIDKIQKGK